MILVLLSGVIMAMAGWKIPELNGCFDRKITYTESIFQPAMFDDTGGYVYEPVCDFASRISELIA